MPKNFSWSYSKINNSETCGKRHYEIDLARNFKEPEDPYGPLAWGNKVHEALASSLKNGTALEGDAAEFSTWADRVREGPGELLIEQKYAITKEFAPTAWASPFAWFRGIGDAVRIYDDVALGLDWKTGAVKDDSVQLALLAQCLFSHYPDVKVVRTEFIWLAYDINTTEIFRREEMGDFWARFMPRVDKYREMIETKDFKPTPNGLCKRYCVVTSCPFHGKDFRS
jgi:hypothetical protein